MSFNPRDFDLNRRTWFLPSLLAAGYILLLVVFRSDWAWQLFDDWSWVDYHARFHDFIRFTRQDFSFDGRLRPLSALFPFLKLEILGENPHLQVVSRVLEFLVLAGLALVYLVRVNGIPSALAIFAIGFWYKSPSQLEQIYHFGFSEMTAVTFFLLALLTRRRSRGISYLFVLLAVLVKEPFAVFAALPAFLDEEWREGLAAGFFGALYLFVLFYLRRLNPHITSLPYAFSNLSAHTIATIAKNAFKDIALLIPILYFAWKVRIEKTGSDFIRALVLVVFAVSYMVLVSPRSWDFNYIYMPGVFLLALAAAFLMKSIGPPLAGSRTVMAYLVLCALLFPARLCYSLTSAYLKSSARHELYATIRSFGLPGPVASNCLVDVKGVGYVAAGRPDGKPCVDAEMKIAECCKDSAALALGAECVGYPERLRETAGLGAKPAYSNSRWLLLDCSSLRAGVR